ncbi:MAG: competence/damage-inducible protein A [Lachnospiraceae bacterium]|uniref:competence/damage-inducible protein A n=1 Tax=Candidatus Merdisoma sp. JLR.KK011 TaxID=3114299 RepID=UPI0014345E05|nr:competence/damage-inducible protein A [Lachnospiraceae bacterium]MCI9624639.1 competence/damage-inducible protein A [Lachnospiraceae bacterium]GFI10810.1 putative competence-damage inducible protein [Lachnospiraceae bacterium]
MIVELISVGTEILLGNIVNTNAAYLSEKCAQLGLSLYYQTVVGDNPDRLEETLKLALERSDIVILGGGLGPTKDDLTKEAAARVLGKKLVEDPRSREMIQKFFDTRGIKEITDNNWKQALVPEGAIVVDNDNGTAPGLILEEGEKTLILLPGPPGEMKPMFEKDIFPYLNQKQPEIIVSEMIKICGMGESRVETMIADLIEKQTNPTIATYAKIGEVHLRLTAKAADEAAARKLMKPVIRELKVRFGGSIYTTNEKMTLEESVVQLLKEQDLTLTTVESCTGGLFTGRLVNVQGASEVLKQGFITYSNKAKRKLIGVKKLTLKEFGAVSDKTAKEMAKGAILTTGSDVAVSITGIAGPDGGTKEKPVGLVYIAVSVKGNMRVEEYHFTGNRMKIRESAVVAALTLLRTSILETIKF